jgi:hypothetical protein
MKHYLEATRSPWGSYLFVLPLLALYQVTALLANLGQRHSIINGADALIQSFLNLAGLHGWLGSWLVVAAVVGGVLYQLDGRRRKGLRAEYFGLLLAESVAYALALGTVVALLTSLLLPGAGYLQVGERGVALGQKLASGLGAGLYEELVFRLLLTGGILGLLRKLRWSDGAAVATAVLASSLLFSLFHYVGPYADPFQVTSFVFRFVAGVVLAALFSARGFAVAAWTHAFYDVFLLVALAGRA